MRLVRPYVIGSSLRLALKQLGCQMFIKFPSTGKVVLVHHRPSSSFTVGRGPMTLPAQGDRVKDGYSFAGWSTTAGGAVVSNYEPTANGVLYAKWDDGNYTLSYNAQNGPTPVTQVLVQRTASTALRTPTRPNFRFIGWFDALTGGNYIGNAGEKPYQPTAV
jgi:uncharacterized repeat protein (TIGR02543 family)